MSALTHLATPLAYLVGLLLIGGLLFLVASFAFGRGERMAPMPPDVPPVMLPASRPATGRDVRRLRLSVVLRGYRMSEVDWVLDRLAEQIDERDRELARLRDASAGLADGAAAGEPAEPAGRTGPAGGVDRVEGAVPPPAAADRVDLPADEGPPAGVASDAGSVADSDPGEPGRVDAAVRPAGGDDASGG